MDDDVTTRAANAAANGRPRPFRKYRDILRKAIQDPDLPGFATQDDYIFHLEKRIITLERWIEVVEALLPEPLVPPIGDEAELVTLVHDLLYGDRPKGVGSQ